MHIGTGEAYEPIGNKHYRHQTLFIYFSSHAHHGLFIFQDTRNV